jgi:MoaA/NifB/PqqE/SkfB family radical SAM enzyme
MKTNDVAINGHGETTTVGDWPKISSAIRKSGARVHLTSNFARPFSPGEFHELAMMASVVVSLDTDDPEMLRKVRRSVSIHTLLENIRGLKDVAARLGVTCPPIVASCVVYTDNVMALDRFVFAVRNGFRDSAFAI